MDGWMCPGCGCCYAPSVWKCPSCGPRTVTATGNDGNAGGCRHVPGPIETAGQRCVLCGEIIPPPQPVTITVLPADAFPCLAVRHEESWRLLG